MKAYRSEYKMKNFCWIPHKMLIRFINTAKKQRITPFIDPNPGHTGYFTYKDDFTTNNNGVPICKTGFRMYKDRHEPA